MAVYRYKPKTILGTFINELEETLIAVLLGLMTLLTFTNVVLRYVFDSLLIWSLEVVLMMFAWLVLLGTSYAFKVTAHLGVDVLINTFAPPMRKTVALIAGALCILYAVMLLKGAWDYWAPFAGLYETTGRWFPTGFNEATRDRAFFETDQVPMLSWLRWLEDAVNQGESYSKLPRLVPYTILPVACLLILIRVVEVTIRIFRGEQESLIVSHEAEEAVEDAARAHGKEER
ncbi:TRAP transporter small permease [Maliponia aquimaris]|uniref:TRAP transporter small permease protein n=1 Tax=Maliponia aquimaris TaxID=1673631 RepID=A0A238K1M9_9RHOB|nr:TRAP transporter small permease [Maliponia aquimaris]SMX36347.1 2,3-diketo-L-gulonate TRAP transporter small permease protein YiaM [Maliponia aquimaris]